MKLKIEKIGDEIGVILPEDVVRRLNVGEAQTSLDGEVVKGGLHLLPRDLASDQATLGGDGRKRE